VAQLLYGWSSLFAIPASSVVAVHADCDPDGDCDAAEAAVSELLTAISFVRR
jgi:hypothetical protein